MNRINQLFAKKQHNILSIYFCAGHPDLDSTMPILCALQEGGIDMVEIGIPFSDPMADGPTIQDAATKALRNGMTLRRLFAQLEALRPRITMPILLMGYFNVILRFGFEQFCLQCKACGIDGAIIPDLPFEVYLRDYKHIADSHGIRIIHLITPETEDERIRQIDDNTDSFIYQVSTDATTGAQSVFGPATIAYFERISNMKLHNPTLVGFGISNRATRNAASQHSAGCIVGSKFVKLLEVSSSPAEAVKTLCRDLNS